MPVRGGGTAPRAQDAGDGRGEDESPEAETGKSDSPGARTAVRAPAAQRRSNNRPRVQQDLHRGKHRPRPPRTPRRQNRTGRRIVERLHHAAKQRKRRQQRPVIRRHRAEEKRKRRSGRTRDRQQRARETIREDARKEKSRAEDGGLHGDGRPDALRTHPQIGGDRRQGRRQNRTTLRKKVGRDQNGAPPPMLTANNFHSSAKTGSPLFKRTRPISRFRSGPPPRLSPEATRGE